jgi:putative peptide zinc metalloprotease protein
VPILASVPKLIDHAIIGKVEQAGRISYVLSDENPDKASYFGLSATTCSIVRLLDGRHEVAEICNSIRELHGVDCTPEQIEGLLRALQENGLLEENAGRKSPAESASQGSRWAPILQWLIQVWFTFKADPLLAKLHPWVTLAARPVVVYALALFGILGFALVVTCEQRNLVAMLEEFRHSTRGTLAGVFVWAGIARLLISFCHEVAHGAACRHFGGRGIRIGAGLYYFTPVFICDTSSTWLIEKKRHRIMVSLAGPLCHLAFGALGACLFILPLPHAVHMSAFILIAIGYGENLLTDFNPLLRYDGYYILSDLLEMPNLRARSFAHMRHLFRGGKPICSSIRERTICLIYGFLAFGYTCFVLFGMVAVLVTLAWGGAIVQSLLLVMGPVLAISSMWVQRRTSRNRGD